jgi:hypothetical protein
MDPREYYHTVIDRMRECFGLSHYVIATGRELAGQGLDPIFPALAEPVDSLWHLTVQRALQVHVPVIGERSKSVLMPLDIEIFLENENHLLYETPKTQRQLFDQILPVIRFIENFLRTRGLPYLLDYTPSGVHILFQNILGHRAWEDVRRIGFVEEDLAKACSYIDRNDIRRWYGVSLEAASVFSGLGKLAEFISLATLNAFQDNEAKGMLPVTISDSYERCINIDNSWNEGSPFMRCIRSPFSLHKKNQEKYGFAQHPPLVDVIGTFFDGNRAQEPADIDFILECMWDLEKAAGHASNFSGEIPCSNESLIDLVREYQSSDLYRFHQDFEQQEDLPKGIAVERAKGEGKISDWTRDIIYHPNPSALQPKKMIWMVQDFLINAGWQAKHIANVLRDLYQNPAIGWTQDFFKYPSEEKANYWARTYSAVALWKNGRLDIAVR